MVDRETLKTYFDQGFRKAAAPRPSKPIEQIDKPVVLDGLKRSKRDTKTKGEYGKGTHSFALLGLSDFDKVIRASPRAEHLVKELKKRTTA